MNVCDQWFAAIYCSWSAFFFMVPIAKPKFLYYGPLWIRASTGDTLKTATQSLISSDRVICMSVRARIPFGMLI